MTNRKIFECVKCKYQWMSSIYPNRCAKCNSINWNKVYKDPICEEGEEWRDIKGNQYKVSNKGRIYSVNSEKCISTKTGYVLLHGKMHSVAKILLNAFRIDQECLDYVNYIDGNRYNLSLDNLEWSDISMQKRLSTCV